MTQRDIVDITYTPIQIGQEVVEFRAPLFTDVRRLAAEHRSLLLQTMGQPDIGQLSDGEIVGAVVRALESDPDLTAAVLESSLRGVPCPDLSRPLLRIALEAVVGMTWQMYGTYNLMHEAVLICDVDAASPSQGVH